MAASAGPGAGAGPCKDPAHSASAFPKSFPVISRALSSAGSLCSEASLPSPGSAASSVDGDSPKLSNGGSPHSFREAAAGKENKPDEACNGGRETHVTANGFAHPAREAAPKAPEQGDEADSAVPNGTSHAAEDSSSQSSQDEQQLQPQEQQLPQEQPQLQQPQEEQMQPLQQPQQGQEQPKEQQQPQQIASKASGGSLKAESEPFVPSGGSSRQATPRSTAARSSSGGPGSAAGGSGGGGLNAHAAAFVPAAALAAVATPPPPPPMEPLRFGDLPESLTATPNVGAPQGEWPGANGHSAAAAAADGAEYGQEGQWEGEWGDYGSYDPAAYAEYANGEGQQYYQQADGTWVSYWEGAGEGGSQWQGYWDENGGYSNGYGQDSGRARRAGRGGAKRGGGGGERRRPEGGRGWQAAAADVLEGQFALGREALAEVLELHGGDLPTALDMLAQLEAENAGQLPANGQEAPELNDQNFPSLSDACAEPAAAAAPATKGGFAAAVRSSPPPQQQQQAAAPAKPAAAAAANGHSHASSEAVPWVETGAAVSQQYSDARAEARDHARLRNAYFQEATRAYQAGDRALARDLGAKGREQSELMKAAHVRASQAIYKHRNPTAGRRPGGGGLLDLHGLHVREAIAVLEREVGEARTLRARSGRSPRRLSVLVGTGRHTQGSRTPARLPSAVEEWLKASQIAYTAPVPGLLEVSP